VKMEHIHIPHSWASGVQAGSFSARLHCTAPSALEFKLDSGHMMFAASEDWVTGCQL